MTDYVISPPPQPALAIAGSTKVFPVRRIWCVGRNYLEHIKEMGHDEREPPFFFAKPADAIVPDGGKVPFPPVTKDLHFARRRRMASLVWICLRGCEAMASGARKRPGCSSTPAAIGPGAGPDYRAFPQDSGRARNFRRRAQWREDFI